LNLKTLGRTHRFDGNLIFFMKTLPGKPDFSALENVQVMVVINSFDATEKQITDKIQFWISNRNLLLLLIHTLRPTAVPVAENQIFLFAGAFIWR